MAPLDAGMAAPTCNWGEHGVHTSSVAKWRDGDINCYCSCLSTADYIFNRQPHLGIQSRASVHFSRAPNLAVGKILKNSVPAHSGGLIYHSIKLKIFSLYCNADSKNPLCLTDFTIMWFSQTESLHIHSFHSICREVTVYTGLCHELQSPPHYGPLNSWPWSQYWPWEQRKLQTLLHTLPLGSSHELPGPVGVTSKTFLILFVLVTHFGVSPWWRLWAARGAVSVWIPSSRPWVKIQV